MRDPYKLYVTDEEKKWLIGISIVLIPITIIICLILFTPHSYTIDVRSTNWEWNVYIQEYKTEHKTGRNTYPSDAYNVSKHHHTRTKTDSDGNKHTESYYTYDYDIDMWVDTRTVCNSGLNHDPCYAEYTLKETNNPKGLGSERVSRTSQEYFACGTLVNSDITELQNVKIPYEIWNVLKEHDQLNYEKRKVGDPFNIQIAK